MTIEVKLSENCYASILTIGTKNVVPNKASCGYCGGETVSHGTRIRRKRLMRNLQCKICQKFTYVYVAEEA